MRNTNSRQGWVLFIEIVVNWRIFNSTTKKTYHLTLNAPNMLS